MAEYHVYFEMAEVWWHRYDVEAETPEEAYEIAKNLMQTSPVDPDGEIYDQLLGPYSADVENEDGKSVYRKDLHGGEHD